MMNLSKRGWMSLSLLASIAGPPLLILSGCGGGGNGVTIPPPVVLGTPTPVVAGTPTPVASGVPTPVGSDTPTPVPSPSPTATPTAAPSSNATPTPFPAGTTFTPNYNDQITQPMRWPGFPLKVYFLPGSNSTTANQALVKTGFDEWVTATANRVRYTLTTDAAQADVTVEFGTFTVGAGNILGQTQPTTDSQGTLVKQEIIVLITGDNREDINTAAHEFGHALGIYGHSLERADLMFFEGNSVGCSCITQRDLNTVYTIYGGQFPTVPANARRRNPVGPIRTLPPIN